MIELNDHQLFDKLILVICICFLFGIVIPSGWLSIFIIKLTNFKDLWEGYSDTLIEKNHYFHLFC